MKICIVSLNSYYFFSGGKKSTVGGAELDMFLVGKYLSMDKDFEVSFIVGDFGQPKVENYGDIKLYSSISIKDRKVFDGIFSIVKFIITLKKVNADYYVKSSASHYVGIISLFCKFFGKKFIYRTASDTDCNETVVNKKGFLRKLYLLGIIQAYKIIIETKNHGKMLLETHGKKFSKKLIYIPLGIEMNENSPCNKDIILWVARGVGLKRPKLFLEISQYFTQEKFVLIMPEQAGEEKVYQEIRSAAESLSNVEFIGGVPFSETQKYFNKAKIFINTSDYEGYTITLIQSGLGRTPVVFLRVNPDNVIEIHDIGYCSYGSLEKMRTQIQKLLSDKEDWKIKSDNCFDFVKLNHDIGNCVDKYKEFFLNDKNS